MGREALVAELQRDPGGGDDPLLRVLDGVAKRGTQPSFAVSEAGFVSQRKNVISECQTAEDPGREGRGQWDWANSYTADR
jgi:hypothetical protein